MSRALMILAIAASLAASVHVVRKDMIAEKLRKRAESDVLREVRPPSQPRGRSPVANTRLRTPLQVKELVNKQRKLQPEHYHEAIQRDWEDGRYLVR